MLAEKCMEPVIRLSEAFFFRAETMERNCEWVVSPRERAYAAMANVKVLLAERAFSSRNESASFRAVLIFWKQGKKILMFLCEASIYQLTWTTPMWHHPGVDKIRGGKRNDIMEMDGVWQKVPEKEQSIISEVKMRLSKSGQAFCVWILISLLRFSILVSTSKSHLASRKKKHWAWT